MNRLKELRNIIHNKLSQWVSNKIMYWMKPR